MPKRLEATAPGGVTRDKFINEDMP